MGIECDRRFIFCIRFNYRTSNAILFRSTSYDDSINFSFAFHIFRNGLEWVIVYVRNFIRRSNDVVVNRRYV